jgi:hypothetical protein
MREFRDAEVLSVSKIATYSAVKEPTLQISSGE